MTDGPLIIETTGGKFPKVSKVRRGTRQEASTERVFDENGVYVGRRFKDWEPVPIPVEQIQASLPPVVRRSPQERYRDVLTKINADAIASYRATGQVAWPKSAEEELKRIGWVTGDPTLADIGGIEQVRRQAEALTRALMEKTENKQKRNDGKRTAAGWHGH